MEGSAASDTRQRVLKWIQDGQSLVGLVQGLLDETEQLKTKAQAVEGDCERLRQENDRLRKEQEEILGGFGRLVGDMLRPMNEMMQKIRGTQSKNPFERVQSADAQKEPPRAFSGEVASR